MTFHNLNVCRLPNIIISTDTTAGSLTNYIVKFTNYLANNTTNSTFAGEKATGFSIDSGGNITVTKKCLIAAKLIQGTTSNGGVYYAEYEFQSGGVAVGTGARSDSYIINSAMAYYTPTTAVLHPTTAYAILNANDVVNVKVTSALGAGLAVGSYIQIFELE
jgi:hypothetical protein